MLLLLLLVAEDDVESGLSRLEKSTADWARCMMDDCEVLGRSQKPVVKSESKKRAGAVAGCLSPALGVVAVQNRSLLSSCRLKQTRCGGVSFKE